MFLAISLIFLKHCRSGMNISLAAYSREHYSRLAASAPPETVTCALNLQKHPTYGSF
jgi:hypothetical protein